MATYLICECCCKPPYMCLPHCVMHAITILVTPILLTRGPPLPATVVREGVAAAAAAEAVGAAAAPAAAAPAAGSRLLDLRGTFPTRGGLLGGAAGAAAAAAAAAGVGGFFGGGGALGAAFAVGLAVGAAVGLAVGWPASCKQHLIQGGLPCHVRGENLALTPGSKCRCCPVSSVRAIACASSACMSHDHTAQLPCRSTIRVHSNVSTSRQ